MTFAQTELLSAFYIEQNEIWETKHGTKKNAPPTRESLAEVKAMVEKATAAREKIMGNASTD